MDPSSRIFLSVGTNRVILIIALIVLVVLSAFFSATETAYSSSNRIRLKSLEAGGNKRAKKVLKQIENYDKLLSTILIGNNIVNITAASLGTVLFINLLGAGKENLATTLSTVTITVIVLIFGEITPKSIAKEKPEAFCMAVQPIMSFLIVLLLPLNYIFVGWKWLIKKVFKLEKETAITEDELITMVEEAENEGEINEHESQLIRSAIEFEDLDIKDIMVPRVKVVAVEDDMSMDEIAEVFDNHGFSRLPVYNNTIDSIIGIVHEKDFFSLYRNNRNDINSVIQSSLCLSPNMKISAALRALQKAKVHMAVVVDEFGGTAGIVTMEDILEELVGEIWDEHDEVQIFSKSIDDHTFIISGSESLGDMFEMLDLDDDYDDFDSTTVGGWITEMLKRIPLAGEKLQYKNLDIEVTKANNKSVLEIKVIVNEIKEEDEDE